MLGGTESFNMVEITDKSIVSEENQIPIPEDKLKEEQEQTLNMKGVKSQVWRVKAKADGESASNSSTPIQAVGSSKNS